MACDFREPWGRSNYVQIGDVEVQIKITDDEIHQLIASHDPPIIACTSLTAGYRVLLTRPQKSQPTGMGCLDCSSQAKSLPVDIYEGAGSRPNKSVRLLSGWEGRSVAVGEVSQTLTRLVVYLLPLHSRYVSGMARFVQKLLVGAYFG